MKAFDAAIIEKRKKGDGMDTTLLLTGKVTDIKGTYPLGDAQFLKYA